MQAEEDKYIIVEACSTNSLARQVNSLMRKGWQLQGGVSGFWNSAGYHYQQAMVKS